MNISQGSSAIMIKGASSGIGKTTALYLEKQGFNVFATVRSEEDADRLNSESSGNLTPVYMDVTDQASIESAREQVSRTVGDAGLRGLVNNAAVGFLAPMECIPLADLRWLFEVNVFGLLDVTQTFLPLLRQGRGRIINISSTATIFTSPFHGPYSSSKLAVNAITEALRLELKFLGVGAALIVCGSVKTPMWEKGSSLSAQVAKRSPKQSEKLYGNHYNKVEQFFFDLGQVGVPTEKVARKIFQALTARRAKNTYYVGSDAVLYSIADKLLYNRLRDWVILKGNHSM